MKQVSKRSDASRLVAGADGCRAGWVRLARRLEAAEVVLEVFPDARTLILARPQPSVLALDAPIGLPGAGPRDCDRLARRLLGAPRSSSVFAAPIRPALSARSQDEASERTQRIDGRRVAAQAWNLYPRIREIDALLRAQPGLRERVREAHPEVCFWAWNAGRPMQFGKKTPEGRDERRALVDAHFGVGAASRALERRPAGVAIDDVLDAFAALWTAERVARGAGRTLPASPPSDAVGLRMEMVY